MIQFEVERDDALIARQIEGIREFWQRVVERRVPDPLPEVDSRCGKCPWRRTCRGIDMMVDPGGNIVREGKGPVRAHDAHHIKPRRTHPELTYDLANLEAVCRPCHAAIERGHK